MVNRTEYINKFFNILLERKFQRATAVEMVSFLKNFFSIYLPELKPFSLSFVIE